MFYETLSTFDATSGEDDTQWESESGVVLNPRRSLSSDSHGCYDVPVRMLFCTFQVPNLR